MNQHKNKIIIGILLVLVLAFAFWYGGHAPTLRGWLPKSSDNSLQTELPAALSTEITPHSAPAEAENGEAAEQTPAEETAPSATPAQEALSEQGTAEEKLPQSPQGDLAYSQANGMVINEATGKDKYLTDPVPLGKPLPVEPQESVISNRELTCTLSIRCDTILDNIVWLDKEKLEIVPKDGVIFAEKTVTFYEGESVFHLLLREMKRNHIHMEFTNTPIYNSAYIEGIANLYEFDCGELSGWMYRVNGWFPNYGCSRYLLKAGDKVEWVYTCDLGADVGGSYAARGE